MILSICLDSHGPKICTLTKTLPTSLNEFPYTENHSTSPILLLFYTATEILTMLLVKNIPSITPLAILVAAALAAPGAVPAPAPVPQTTDPVPAVRRSQCVSKSAPAHIEWGIYVMNTTMPSNQGSGSWGGGLLDNINGKAGCAPTSWQAQLDDADPQGVGCTFNTPDFCTVNQISDAIHAASSENDDKVITDGSGQWVYCEGDTLTDLFDAAGSVISSLSQDLGDVAGFLGAFAK